MENNKKDYYLSHLTSDMDGQDAFLEMPEEYLDDDAILEKSYKYLSKFIVNRSEKLSEKLI